MHASSSTIQETLKRLLERSARLLFPAQAAFQVVLEIPKNRQHCDLTTNIAMRLGRLEKKNPLEVARQVVSSLNKLLKEEGTESTFKKIEVLPPGFINFYFSESHHRHLLAEIASNDTYGTSSIGQGIGIQIEFVSANPTGPLSVAHGRQAAVGDCLARVLAFCGHGVSREYYVNDVGNQIRLLGKSLYIRYKELFGEKAEIPEGGYQGKYLIDLAKEVKDHSGEKYRKETEETVRFFEQYTSQRILEGIRKDLEDFRIHFDNFSHESALRSHGKVEEALEVLRKGGSLFEAEGATWFRSTLFGDDKDRVVVKSDGSFTYLAPDIAYHREKFSRGFGRLINIWGPDHHGYIRRLKAAVQALGHDPASLSILILQLATLYREGVAVPMSTRMGEFITLREVMEEVGVDATRFFFVMKKCSSHLDFDLSLAKKQSLENPVYTIQYAYARVSNILEFGKEKLGEIRREEVSYDLLQNEEELELLKELGEFPNAILSSAKTLEPVYLVMYLQRLAGAFHRFYQKHRVITDDLPLSRARTLLILCVQKTIGRGLSLLGISAPDKM